MAKKKQPPPVATEPTPIDLDVNLIRDVQGYGAIPGIVFDATQMEISEAQLAAIVDRQTAIAAANWSEGQVAQMAAECRGRLASEGATHA